MNLLHDYMRQNSKQTAIMFDKNGHAISKPNKVKHKTTDKTASAKPDNCARFHTRSATLQGAFCGHIWMPAVKATLPVNENMRSRFERFSTSDISFRDALLSLLNSEGGDFQDPMFTADTVLRIVRVKHIAPGRIETHTKEIEVSQLPGCEDLVDADCHSYDFDNQD